MNPDELDRLIHGYFEGTLSADEERGLWQFVRTDKAAADRFVELSELESALVESLKAEEAAPPEVGSSSRISRRRVRVLPSPTATRRAVWPLFFAAALMLGFVTLLVQSASKTEPPPMVHRPELPRPKPEAAAPGPMPVPRKPETPRPAPEFKTADLPTPKPVVEPKPSDPAPVPPKPEPKPEPPTTVVVADPKPVEARIDKVEGDVIDDSGARAKVGPLMSGLDVRGAKASAVVSLLDGTKVELQPDTKLEKVLVSADHKRFVLSRGMAVSTVTKQVGRTSVVFQTPHAEVTVLGTKLTIEVGKDSTKVDVHEGRVRCRRLPDGPSVEIASGKFAIAGKSIPLTVKPILTVRSFQDGPDYQGTSDTWLSAEEPNANFAKGSLLRLRKLSGHLTTLIRWDVSAIPPGSRIISAEMRFWVTGALVGDVKIYDLRRPFEEGEATWKLAATGRPWVIQGAQSDGDRGAREVAVLAPEKPGFIVVPMNELGVRLVQDWVNAPRENYGILVLGPGVNEWNLDSRETAVQDRRPKLTITSIPPQK
jgi:outer membrane biosynthesis protein TonB